MSLGFLINMVLNSKVVEIKGFDSFGDQFDSDGGFGFPVRKNGILEDLRFFFFIIFGWYRCGFKGIFGESLKKIAVSIHLNGEN